MDNIKGMTNTEFLTHLMDGYSKYGALVQMVVIDCLQKALNEYIENEDMILEEAEAMRESGRISLINMEAWVACCKETLNRIEYKYS